MVVRLRVAYERGKAHAIAVVAEGVRYGAKGAGPLLQEHRHLGFELRATILGRAQRGGMPGVFDRLLGIRLGVAATERLARGLIQVLVGLKQDQYTNTPLAEVVSNKKPLDLSLLEVARVLQSEVNAAYPRL